MTADLPRSYTEHKEAAEQLLTMAHEVESTPKCHLAKTYALMSQAHTALAALAIAERQHEFETTPPVIKGLDHGNQYEHFMSTYPRVAGGIITAGDAQ